MGFPAVGYSGMPRLLLHSLSLLSHLRRLSSWLLRLTGALDADYYYINPADADYHVTSGGGLQEELDAHSPAVRFDALRLPLGAGAGEILLPEDCAVCLADFHGAARVRRPRACRHVFHRACLDRWASSRGTCPLCRTPLLPPPLPATATIGH